LKQAIVQRAVGALFMPRSTLPRHVNFLAFDRTYQLTPFVLVIMIRMAVTPVPIRSLFFHLQFHKGVILLVPFAKVHAKGSVFVVIPVVIVVVGAVVDPVVILVVSVVFFLASIVLWPGRSHHYRWGGKGCREKKGTEKISVTTVHVIFLLARDFRPGNPACEDYAFVFGRKMFDTAHLFRPLGLNRGLTK
jgi:hypothetical protein